MKNWIMILTLILVLPGLTACGKKDNKRTSITDRSGRNPVGTDGDDAQTSGGGTTVSKNGYVYGQIYNESGRTDATFETNVRGFTSATLDPWGDSANGRSAELGRVSAQKNQSTGVWFRGDLRVQGGNFDPSGGSQRQLDTANSNMRIIIYDSYAGKADASGNIIPEYGVSFLQASSQSYINYSSRQVFLHFEDDYGYVTFTGTYNENWFYGLVKYYNHDYVSSIIAPNDGAWDGELGDFVISTCGLFYCD